MCGIAGYFGPGTIDPSPVLNALAHRGPDDRGVHSERVGKTTACLMHTRLSIIDLSTSGHQPMVSRDGTTVICYNGEVYNFEALRSRFLQEVPLRSATDTEVVLELFAQLGHAALPYLEGDFAVAFLDRKNRVLTLVRDRMGVKPLYVAPVRGGFAFGSEIKALLGMGLEPALDTENIEKFFAFKYSPGQETLFKGVQRIPPGHYATYDLDTGKFDLRKYWALEKRPEFTGLRFADAQATLRKTLRQAVESQLVADVPIGTFLSGGVDSSVIASFLRDRSDISHFCAAKEESDLKEEGSTSDAHFARILAEAWDLDLGFLSIGSDEASMELIRKTLWYSDDLIADGSQIPSWLITREARRKGSTVILSGMGADELFLGYASHMISLLSHYMDKLPGGLSRLMITNLRSIRAGKGAFKPYKRFLYKLGRSYDHGMNRFGIFGMVGDYENSVSILKTTDRSTLGYLETYFQNDGDVFDSIFHFDRENFLVKNLHYTDRMSMANSVECRVPFLDRNVVELAYSLPREYKLSNFGKPKKVLKRAFSDTLPSQILRRRKAGFGMPLRSIFSRPDKVSSLLDRSLIGDLGLFDLEGIDNIITNHQRGMEDNSALIYALISFQEWYKMFINK